MEGQHLNCPLHPHHICADQEGGMQPSKMKNKTCQIGMSSLSANIQHATLGSIGNTPIAHPQVLKG